jgi:hypothetical protein
MTPLSIIISAFLAALILASLTFMGGAVPVAIPAAILLIAVIGWTTYAGRRGGAGSSPRYAEERERAVGDDEPSAEERRTLYTGDPEPRAH